MVAAFLRRNHGVYFSRNCDRQQRGKGMYPILLLWGVHDRCTAALASEVGKLTAMLSSFD